MALEGNLSSFGLSEILQLIGVQQKTGMLTLTSENDNVVMFFRDGQVISTRDRRRRARDPFRDYVTRYGILSREDLTRIAQIASQSKLDFIDIIASEGFLDEEELLVQWQKQIQEAMHDMLTWEQCSYKFITSEEIVDGIRSPAQYSIEAMLMESMRRIDEFPQTLEMFPNDRILVTRVDDDSDDTDGLTRNEKGILALLTDIVSLRDLIASAGMPLFEVYEALKLLKDKGLVKTQDEARPARAGAGAAAAQKAKRKGPGNLLPLAAVLVVFLAAAAFGFYQPVMKMISGDAFNVTFVQDDDQTRTRLDNTLRWHLEAYRATHGLYPPDLNALVTSGIASQSLIDDAEEQSFRYRLTPGRPAYTLL